jgi:hypothetical protein
MISELTRIYTKFLKVIRAVRQLGATVDAKPQPPAAVPEPTVECFAENVGLKKTLRAQNAG